MRMLFHTVLLRGHTEMRFTTSVTGASVNFMDGGAKPPSDAHNVSKRSLHKILQQVDPSLDPLACSNSTLPVDLFFLLPDL